MCGWLGLAVTLRLIGCVDVEKCVMWKAAQGVWEKSLKNWHFVCSACASWDVPTLISPQTERTLLGQIDIVFEVMLDTSLHLRVLRVYNEGANCYASSKKHRTQGIECG